MGKDTEIRIRKFRRYVDDSIGIWKGRKDKLEKRVKEIEDEEKGIKLKLEMEKGGDNKEFGVCVG